MTIKTKAPVRKGSKAKAPVREGLAFLIEDALERSEVVIAAESIVEKLQSIAEDLSTIEAKDIMPLLDSLTNAFGPEVAQSFNNVSTEQVRQLISAVQGAKTALDGEILRLKQGVEGGDMSDMGAAATPMMPAAPGAAAEPAGPKMGEQPGALPDVPTDVAGNSEDDALGGNFAGRERKAESRKMRGKRIAEDMGLPHSHESTNFVPNINNLAVYNAKAGRLAQTIAGMIRAEELPGDVRRGLANVISHIAAFGADPSHWAGVEAEQKLDMCLKAAGIWKVETPAEQKIVGQMKRLAHLLSMHHDNMLESNIAMLRKASDPDAIILKMFRTKLAEHRDAQMAAIRAARAFAIDIEDVVAVVKEAAARRPFPTKLINAKKKMAEDSPLQGVPMFPVEQASAASSIVQNPMNAPTNAQPQTSAPMAPGTAAPVPGNAAPNATGAPTNKPLTPADKRAQQNAAQQQAALQKAPTGGNGQPQQGQVPQDQQPYRPKSQPVQKPSRGFMQK